MGAKAKALQIVVRRITPVPRLRGILLHIIDGIIPHTWYACPSLYTAPPGKAQVI
jgi:hypothetical protein